MKDSFEELYRSLMLDRQNSEWSREHTLSDRAEELLGEVKEVKLALENEDYDNLREELGDALWDLMFMIVIAEEKNLFLGKDVIEEALAKLRRRKPWIFTGEKVTKAEESRIWNDVKQKEKDGYFKKA